MAIDTSAVVSSVELLNMPMLAASPLCVHSLFVFNIVSELGVIVLATTHLTKFKLINLTKCIVYANVSRS